MTQLSSSADDNREAKYEFKVKRLKVDGDLEATLNRLGSLGWAVVSSTQDAGDKDLVIILQKDVS